MMAKAIRLGTRPRALLSLDSRKCLFAHRKTIDELPKMEDTAHFPTCAQVFPSTRAKHSARITSSSRSPMQAFLLEFAATQEDHTVSATSASIAL